MRFNPADRGAWYAAIDVETCIREVGYHLTNALGEANDFNAVVEYGEMLSSMSGVFVDLRQVPDHPGLDPNPSIGYPAGNALAAAPVPLATMGLSTHRCGMEASPASQHCGPTLCNRSFKAECIV